MSDRMGLQVAGGALGRPEAKTLRDEFAMAALAAMAAPLMSGANSRRRIAVAAYAWADDMMVVRELDPEAVRHAAERDKSSLGGV